MWNVGEWNEAVAVKFLSGRTTKEGKDETSGRFFREVYLTDVVEGMSHCDVCTTSTACL